MPTILGNRRESRYHYVNGKEFASPVSYWVEWFKSESDIHDELWQACFRPPLEGRWWYSTLEKSKLHDQFDFSYGVIYKAEEPVGILPTFVMNVPMELVAPPLVANGLRALSKVIPAAGYQRTLFVGSPCAEEGTLGLRPGVSIFEVLGAVKHALTQRARFLKAPMLVWKDFPDSHTPALDKLSSEDGFFKIVSYPGTVVKFQEASIDSYFAQLKGSRRHNLRKKLKRSKQAMSLHASVIQQPSSQVLDEVFGLFWQTYENGKTKFERLNREFFSHIAEHKETWFVLLRDSNQNLVAFMMCFLLGDRIINKFIGLDYEHARQNFLYFRLWEAAVEWAISLGITEIQSGQTGYRAKIDVGHSLVPLTNYCKHENPVVNKIYAFIERDVTWSSLDEDLRVFLEAHPEAESAE